MSKRDELAAVLSWSSGQFTRWSPEAHPDHNHWSWQGDGHGEEARRTFREQADAVLAWLGEQFDEGLREAVVAPLLTDAWPIEDAHDAVDAALGVVRARFRSEEIGLRAPTQCLPEGQPRQAPRQQGHP